ncbi:Altered inheritance of mitochondria protein 6-like protein [Lasiodiplodia hormozganensis]|uniref:Altered inheritance of mitochondria protein 6 n=1 Tax=Lasiodiplodia hormozganensis TaxID=869390 RepID=A0AA39Z596_9PEZI|nr:Altered inheritance of mitochondria protein 6-like protein [Lasiodiplodia hormozganensis]
MPNDHRLYSASYFQNVLPVPCHSHNDYWRTTPLYAALGSGCVSVEADVWLRNGELYVGHSAFELTEGKTLSNTYLNPLHSILQTTNNAAGKAAAATSGPRRRGVFYMSPTQTLTLLIDLKTAGDDTLAALHAQLEPLRAGGWLTHWNGSARVERPVTVVASGNAPFDALVANTTYRDVFFDAPLAALHDAATDSPTAFVAADGTTPLTKYNPSNSHLASAKLADAVGPLRHGRLSAWQLRALQGQILAAKRRGLVPRYWGTPRWPRGLRDEIWEVLVREEVGLLSVDDLRAARKGRWGLWPQDGGGGGRG